MALAAVGLQTHIWNNKVKSAALLAGYPLLLLLLLFLFHFLEGMFFGSPHYANLAEHVTPTSFAWHHALWRLSNSWPTAFIVTAIWFTIAWFSHQSMINRATGAHPVTRREQPELYNLLENLCISRGITTPKLYIIDTPVLNAYASGINEKTYAVTVTQGLLATLDRDELEAVLAHELTHIINQDVRLLIIGVIFVGMISFAAELAWRSLRYGMYMRSGRGRNNGGGAMILLLAAIVLAVGYFFAIVIRFSISRKREFLADAGAVELTRNPDAMVRALQKISGNARIEDAPAEVAQMFIENPPSAGFFDLFATHPPIHRRIAALVELGGANPALLDSPARAATTGTSPWKRRSATATKRSPWG